MVEWLISQVQNPQAIFDFAEIAKAIGALGGSGFAIWYAWHTTTHTLPDLVRQFRDEMQLERAENSRQLDKAWDTIRAEMAARHADSERLSASVNKLAEAMHSEVRHEQ